MHDASLKWWWDSVYPRHKPVPSTRARLNRRRMAHDHASLHRTPLPAPIHSKNTFPATNEYRMRKAQDVRGTRKKSTAIGFFVLPYEPDQCHDGQRADGEVRPHRQDVSLKGDFDVRKLTARGVAMGGRRATAAKGGDVIVAVGGGSFLPRQWETNQAGACASNGMHIASRRMFCNCWSRCPQNLLLSNCAWNYRGFHDVCVRTPRQWASPRVRTAAATWAQQ